MSEDWPQKNHLTLFMVPLKVATALLAFAAISNLVVAQYDANKAMDGLYYSKTAYCNNNDIASWSCGPSCDYHSGFKIQGVYTNGTYDAQGYTGVTADGSTIVVAFRGSSNIPNWIADLDYKFTSYPACSGCQVHAGFYAVYLEMSAAMLSDVQTLVNNNAGAAIFVTGHSLGAAVSMHAAVDIMNKISGVQSLELYNFGEPRVGNPTFAAWAASVLPDGKQFRVTHAKDPVPHVPPMDFGFLHCPHELWYDNNGDSSFVHCSDSASAEDPSCSDSTIPIDISDHLLYLGICTECQCNGFDIDRFKKPLTLKL